MCLSGKVVRTFLSTYRFQCPSATARRGAILIPVNFCPRALSVGQLQSRSRKSLYACFPPPNHLLVLHTSCLTAGARRLRNAPAPVAGCRSRDPALNPLTLYFCGSYRDGPPATARAYATGGVSERPRSASPKTALFAQPDLSGKHLFRNVLPLAESPTSSTGPGPLLAPSRVAHPECEEWRAGVSAGDEMKASRGDAISPLQSTPETHSRTGEDCPTKPPAAVTCPWASPRPGGHAAGGSRRRGGNSGCVPFG